MSDKIELWARYRVTITVDRLTGGIPGSEKTMNAWLDKHEINGPDREGQLAVLDRVDVAELHSVVFWRDADGNPAFEGRCFKAMLKEAANILKGVLDVKAFRSKLAERVFVEEKYVPITTLIQSDERPISVMTAQGPRTSLKRYEYTDGAQFTFTLKVLKDGATDGRNTVTESHLQTLLEYCQDNGLGADRSQGSGTFRVDNFEKL